MTTNTNSNELAELKSLNDSLKKDVVEALRELAENGYITDARAFATADNLGLAELYHTPTEITVTITIPVDEVTNYRRRAGKLTDRLNETDVENILNENDTAIEFWVDSITTKEVPW